MDSVSSSPLNKSASLRRRTLMKIIDSQSDMEKVTDASERIVRRSLISVDKKNTISEQNSSSLNDSTQLSGDQEIKNHLQICTKLHAENKITNRVAWQLKVIDVLKVMSKKEGVDALQVASNSLDIGAKVYSVRVDDVYAAGLKLANSMARMAWNDQEQEQEDGDLSDGSKSVRIKQKKKKKRVLGGPKNTIAKEKTSLLVPLDKLESVFFSSRIDSNLSIVENLFTNRLPMDKSCTKFMVLSKEKAWPTGTDEAVCGLEGSSQISVDRLPKEGDICVAFKNFDLISWDVEADQDASVSIMQGQDIVVYDDEGFPVPELDGSICNRFNDDDEDVIQEQQYIALQLRNEIPRIVDAIRSEDIVRSEYSYNSVLNLGNGKVIDQIWAGPSHWKVKFVRRDKVRFTGVKLQNTLKPKRRLKSDPKPMECEDIDSDDLTITLNKMSKIKLKNRYISSNKITLPFVDSSLINIQDLHDLMTLPGTAPVPKTERNQEHSRETEDVNDEINPVNDDMTYFDPGSNDCEELAVNEEEVGVQPQQRNFTGEQLVDAPEYIPKTYVPYALQAKKMNMKKLKTVIWQIMTKNHFEEPIKVVPSSFSELFSALPSILSDSMRRELSCSLAFSALLHLCNEQNLKLIQHQGYKDFSIESDEKTI